MDAKNIQADLQALQKLYRLLKNNGDGMSNKGSDMLDEHSRLFLKNLLDAATQRVLKAHAQLIASRVDGSSALPIQLQQTNDASKEKPSPQQNFAMTKTVGESFGIDQGSDQKRKLDRLDSLTKKRFSIQGSEIGSMEQPIFRVGAGGPEYRKKRCRVCQRSTVKPLVSTEEPSLYYVAQNSNRSIDLQHQKNDIESIDKPEEASEAIEDIELCMSALFLLEQSSIQRPNLVLGVKENFMDKNNILCKFTSQNIQEPEDHTTHNLPFLSSSQAFVSVQPTNTVLKWSTSQFTRSKGQAMGSYESDEPVEEQKLSNQVRGKNVKAIIERIESGKWRTENENNVPKQIPNEVSNKTLSWPATLSSAPKIESTDQNHMAKSRSSNRWGKPVNLRFRENRSDTQHKDGILKNRKYEISKKQISESTTSSSYSNWKTQQASSTYSNSEEEYSSSNQSRTLTQSTRCDSASRATQSQYGSFTSNSENEVYSMSGDGSREVTSSRMSKSDGYSSFDQPRPKYSLVESTSRRADSSRIRESAKGINSKKKVGTWKKLKDRLAIIFHHHHHHHHHNHEDDQKKTKHFRSKREAEAYGEKAVNKMRKSVVKNQHSHFHGLMDAVLRHVRHTKRSRPVDKIGPLAKSKGGNKTGLNKSHWWKLLQHHRKAKLQNKTNVKFGVSKKKPHLKARPMMK